MKMIYRILFFAAAVLISSTACNNGKKHDRLPPALMQKVLIDITLAEAYSSQVKKDSLPSDGKKNYDSLSVFYGYVFDHYKISQDQFNESMNWYKNHPDELDSVCEKIIPVVARWQSAMPHKEGK